jgi:hypothetical protein
MIEPKVALAYAPRGPGVMCALFYFVDGEDVYGWFTGARAAEFPASFFALEGYYSKRETGCYRSVEDDCYGAWVAMTAAGERPLDPPAPIQDRFCHELERLQDAFVREWLFHPDDSNAAAESAEYAKRELAVQPVNIRAKKLNKFVTTEPVWTYASADLDARIVGFLAKRWPLDYTGEA